MPSYTVTVSIRASGRKNLDDKPQPNYPALLVSPHSFLVFSHSEAIPCHLCLRIPMYRVTIGFWATQLTVFQ